jgi:hypothetical protein
MLVNEWVTKITTIQDLFFHSMSKEYNDIYRKESLCKAYHLLECLKKDGSDGKLVYKDEKDSKKPRDETSVQDESRTGQNKIQPKEVQTK